MTHAAGGLHENMPGWNYIALNDREDGLMEIMAHVPAIGSEGDPLAALNGDGTMIGLLKAVLEQLALINARLNAGIKTQSVVSVPATVSV